MLEGDFRAIPDLRFDIQLLICEPPHVGCRQHFDCAPAATLFGLPVNGKRVTGFGTYETPPEADFVIVCLAERGAR